MPFVLDASVALSWHFDDEVSPYAERVLDMLSADSALVPSICPLEVANGLTLVERRGRITPARFTRALELSLDLPLTVVDVSLEKVLGLLVELAKEHRLTVYDAAYLEFAIREGLPLATQDDDLVAAAKRVGLPELA